MVTFEDKKFTSREIDVIACLVCVRGQIIEIASFLSLSPLTVKAHIRKIMHKIGCNSRQGVIDFVEQSNGRSMMLIHYQRLETVEKNKVSVSALNIKERISKKHRIPLKIRRFIKNKRFATFLFSLTIFCILFLIAHYKDGDSDLPLATYVRSDLCIPTEPSLLHRSALIEKLKDHFSQQATHKSIITAVGLAGVSGSGKTTLARAFAKTMSTPIVWEINSETQATIIDSFKNLAVALAQTNKSKKELSDIYHIQNPETFKKRIVAFVAVFLRKNPNWFLIYDNVESSLHLEGFYPTDTELFGSGKIILIKRDQSAKSGFSPEPHFMIIVDALKPSETLSLFTKTTYGTEPYVFSHTKEKKLSHFLSCIPPYPLDVSIVSHYIKNTGISYESYIYLLQNTTDTENKALKTPNQEPYAHLRTKIISLTIKRLIDAEPEFKNLFQILEKNTTEKIPYSLFERHYDQKTVERFVMSLEKHGLIMSNTSKIRNKNTFFSIHQSIKNVITDFLSIK